MEVEKVVTSLLLVAVETVVQGPEGTVVLPGMDPPARVWCLLLVEVILAVMNPLKRLLVVQQVVVKDEYLHHAVVQQAGSPCARQSQNRLPVWLMKLLVVVKLLVLHPEHQRLKVMLPVVLMLSARTAMLRVSAPARLVSAGLIVSWCVALLNVGLSMFTLVVVVIVCC